MSHIFTDTKAFLEGVNRATERLQLAIAIDNTGYNEVQRRLENERAAIAVELVADNATSFVYVASTVVSGVTLRTEPFAVSKEVYGDEASCRKAATVSLQRKLRREREKLCKRMKAQRD